MEIEREFEPTEVDSIEIVLKNEYFCKTKPEYSYWTFSVNFFCGDFCFQLSRWKYNKNFRKITNSDFVQVSPAIKDRILVEVEKELRRKELRVF